MNLTENVAVLCDRPHTDSISETTKKTLIKFYIVHFVRLL